MFARPTSTIAFLLIGAILTARAQAPTPPAAQPDPLMQLMLSQPRVDITSAVTATATFDPPIIRPGGKCTYRVTFSALSDSITEWPDKILAPAQLEMRPGARGQILFMVGTNYQPLTAINYQVRVTQPGNYFVPSFLVDAYGRPVTVPSTRLLVVAEPGTPIPPVPQLILEVADTNVFLGQSVNVRVSLPSPVNSVQMLSQVQFNGGGFLVDQSAARQRIGMLPREGRDVAAFIYETMITPLAGKTLTLSAQGFTTGNRFSGPIAITGQVVISGGLPQYMLLESEPVTLNIRPLPRDGELPGFTGAIGSFMRDPPQLTTNMVRVGDPVKLMVTVRGDGNLARLVAPPAPRVRDWQVFAGVAGNAAPTSAPSSAAAAIASALAQPAPPGVATTFTYTLIPLTEEARATPAIPFSCFDPQNGGYVDLTIPSVPVTVTPGTAPTSPLALTNEPATEKKLALSNLSTSPGQTSASLVPLQRRGWFPPVQLGPLLGFAGLWAWDRRRRHLDKHPDILLRRRARRALRGEKRALRSAARAGDAQRFATRAVTALRVACAPHFPAEPRALVCGDVLQLLGEADRSGPAGEVVQRFFAVTDAACFATESADDSGLIALQSELERVLDLLEGRL